MKLYIYDHCPFCVRARMIFGVRDVAVEEVVLPNDDEATPIGMIGAKQVPILQKDNGEYMGESLDIVAYVNELAGFSALSPAREAIEAWLQNVNMTVNALVAPRYVQVGLPEFANQSAIDYFVQKKEFVYGNFAEHLAKTDEWLATIQQDLLVLSELLLSENFANGEDLNLDDVLIFPVLRNLTIVRGIQFPSNVLNYLQNMAQKTKVNTYFDVAI